MGGILLRKCEGGLLKDKLNAYLTYPPCHVKGFLAIHLNAPDTDNARHQMKRIM